jgi:hypothetical protein
MHTVREHSMTHCETRRLHRVTAAVVPTAAGAAAQNLGVQPGPGGASSQNLGVQPNTALPQCLVPVFTLPGNATAGGPGCENRTSETTRNEQDTFNFGGAELGSAAANLISAAVIGLPSLALDIIQGIFHSV